MRFDVVSWIEMGVFWDVTSCNLAEMRARFTGTSCPYHQARRICPRKGGSRFLWSASTYL